MIEFDVLIVGGGGAGMRAAMEAAKTGGISIGLLSKTSPLRSTTGCTGGGMNAFLPENQTGDSLEQYASDTIAGSGFLADWDAVRFFVEQSADAIAEMDGYGVPFFRSPDGLIAQRKGGGASFPRVCLTHGHSIAHSMYEQLLRCHVTELSGHCLLELVVIDGTVNGVISYDSKTGEVVPIAAKAVVIATGGYSRIYWSRTTTPFGSTGDGIAACLNAGIAFKDPEFVQFHPTALAETGILISEGARSEGGRLFNGLGERFMARYAPEKMELATRDLVSFAIEKEISEGRGCGQGLQAHVMLDLRHLGEKIIRERLAQVYQTAVKFAGVDPLTEMIPIRPASHFVMGGIDVVDYRTCATSVNGVFAAGECASVSIHGANRLGGNALTELLVFGKAAGNSAAHYAQAHQLPDQEAVSKAAVRWHFQDSDKNTQHSYQQLVNIRSRIAAVMWNKAGIIRNETGMTEALAELKELQENYDSVMVRPSGRKGDLEFIHYVEIGNMLAVAQAVVMAALLRPESRGGHCRTDFPELDDQFAKHSLVSRTNGVMSVEYRALNQFQLSGGR